jgi:hypothetical protein
MRHYRASAKLTIDELSMFICRDVGCDLSYCQHLVGKPRSSTQSITDCTQQFNNFRDCIVREKKIFRNLVSDEQRKDPMAIPNYLEKHFKEREKLKKEMKMMGGMTDELKEKIEEMEAVNTANRKMVDTASLKQ